MAPGRCTLGRPGGGHNWPPHYVCLTFAAAPPVAAGTKFIGRTDGPADADRFANVRRPRHARPTAVAPLQALDLGSPARRRTAARSGAAGGRGVAEGDRGGPCRAPRADCRAAAMATDNL